MAPLHEGCRSVLYHVATTLWLCSFDSIHSVQCRTSAPTAACKLGGIHPFPFMTASLLMERSLMQWALFHIEKLSMLDCNSFRAWTTRCSFPRSRRSQSATDGRLVICGSCCCHGKPLPAAKRFRDDKIASWLCSSGFNFAVAF